MQLRRLWTSVLFLFYAPLVERPIRMWDYRTWVESDIRFKKSLRQNPANKDSLLRYHFDIATFEYYTWTFRRRVSQRSILNYFNIFNESCKAWMGLHWDRSWLFSSPVKTYARLSSCDLWYNWAHALFHPAWFSSGRDGSTLAYLHRYSPTTVWTFVSSFQESGILEMLFKFWLHAEFLKIRIRRDKRKYAEDKAEAPFVLKNPKIISIEISICINFMYVSFRLNLQG